MYDPALGRWHCNDPLAERYYSYSPYCYVGNNPIKRIDPDGRYWDDEEDENTAEQQQKNLENRDNYLAKQEQKTQAKIDKVNSNDKLTAEKKSDKLDKLNSKLDDLGAMREDVLNAQTELRMMGENKDIAFAFNDLGSEATQGYISHDKNSKGDLRVTINHTGSFGNISHELNHGFQAMLGIMTPVAGDSKKWDFGKVNPQYTEASAYQRQYSVGGTMPYSHAGKVNNYNDITSGWVSVICTANGVGCLSNIKKNHPYTISNYR
jgi:hypothetical protein